MKKGFILVSILLSIGGFILNAQSSKDLLDKMTERIGHFQCTKIYFNFEAADSKGAVIVRQTGVFYGQSEFFRMKSSDVEIYCDGVSKWVYDINGGELTILPHNPKSRDITENPFDVISKNNFKNYSYSKPPKKLNFGGKSTYSVVLLPMSKGEKYERIELILSASDYLPVAINYVSKKGDKYSVKISSINGVEAKESGYFIPESSIFDSAVVTDLR